MMTKTKMASIGFQSRRTDSLTKPVLGETNTNIWEIAYFIFAVASSIQRSKAGLKLPQICNRLTPARPHSHGRDEHNTFQSLPTAGRNLES
jgi:hypothetical protein